MLQKIKTIFYFIFFIIILSGCGKVNEIKVIGIKNVQLKGLQKNVIKLNVELEVDNPNRRKITITHVNFKAWLNARELGTLETTESIKLIPCSQNLYPVTVEIKLRTAADALRLMAGSFDDILNRIEVEGYIKGKSFPVRKKIVVERQPFSNLSKTL